MSDSWDPKTGTTHSDSESSSRVQSLSGRPRSSPPQIFVAQAEASSESVSELERLGEEGVCR